MFLATYSNSSSKSDHSGKTKSLKNLGNSGHFFHEKSFFELKFEEVTFILFQTMWQKKKWEQLLIIIINDYIIHYENILN
jgi:hypothetical protein